MVGQVSEKLGDVLQLCAQFRVHSLELFGSAAKGNFDAERSDLDFLVTFAPMDPVDYARAYFGLLTELQRLFGTAVDLVELEAQDNPYFLAAIGPTRELLYAA
jgi:uncharacterized protein